ncbi:MAG: PhoH family protein, partial [Myxococcota bacterium]
PMGLRAVNYEESSVSIEQLYPGATTLDVSDGQLRQFFSDRSLTIDHQLGNGHNGADDAANNTLRIAGDREESAANNDLPVLWANEYILLRNRSNHSHTALGRFISTEGRIVPLRLEEGGVWGLRPRNKEQHFALDALLDDRIKLVTLLGKAGTGKTLLALSAGLQRTIENQLFKRLLVSRPIFPLGRDVGYLPGSVEEKLNPWMQPIFDNVEFLLGLKQIDKRTGRTPDELIRSGLMQIEPLTFIRGRSIPNQYLIVDEAQNLTPHEVKTIITRVGQGTKVVLTGDPYQIDNPYVDSESNGLTYTINRFRGQPIAATVTLFKGERSELAELASNLL